MQKKHNKTKTIRLQHRLQGSAQGATAVSMLLPRRLANFWSKGGRWVRGTVTVSTELIMKNEGTRWRDCWWVRQVPWIHSYALRKHAREAKRLSTAWVKARGWFFTKNSANYVLFWTVKYRNKSYNESSNWGHIAYILIHSVTVNQSPVMWWYHVGIMTSWHLHDFA